MLRKVIIIIGPTCSKKSALAFKIAKTLNFPVINTDVFQSYKQLEIGVNKTPLVLRNGVETWMFDKYDIDQQVDAFIFRNEVREIVNKIPDEKLAILVGGSGLYVDAIWKNYNFQNSYSRLNNSDEIYASKSNEELYQMLIEKNKGLAMKTHPNNRRRVISYLGISSRLDEEKIVYYQPLIIELQPDTQKLRLRISSKVEDMLNQGWKKEVNTLIKNCPNFFTYPSSKALGYKQVASSDLPNNIEIEKLIWTYARKQLTWNRNQYKDINKCTINDFGDTQHAFEKSLSYIRGEINALTN